jgi:Tetratricopeptide repeat
VEESNSVGTGRWQKRFAILFLTLFALFWSLGPFFFWVPLSLAVYFGFLSLWYSQSVRNSMKDFFASVNTRRPVMNPYQTTPPRPVVHPAGVVSPASKAAKVVRNVMIFIALLFMFFFFVGIFFGDDQGGSTSETVGVSGSKPDEETGTIDWNEKGNAALANSLYDSARYYYDQVLTIDPENTFGLYNKGLSYTLQKDFVKANSYARKCGRYHPDYNPAWWLLGYNYDLLNNTDSAVYFLEKAYKQGYSQPDFLQLMAEVYIKKSRRSDALQAYVKLVGMDTSRADIWRKMAELDLSNADVYRRKAQALEK